MPRLTIHRAGAPLAALLLLVLAGCNATPLYQSTPAGTGAPIAATLSAISIPPPVDRLTQVVRNELLFEFTGGAAAAAARYEMTLSISVANAAFGVGTNKVATVTVVYSVAEIATGQVVANGRQELRAEYEQTSNQAFANLSAEQEAAERAAANAAHSVYLAVAARFAGG